MYFARKHKYKSRREKNADVWRKVKMGAVIFLIFFTVWLIKNRTYIKDYFFTEY